MRQTPPSPPEYGAEYGAQAGAVRAAPYPLALKPGGYGAAPAQTRAGTPQYGPEYGAEYGAEHGALVIDAKYIEIRLEDAGRALLALPNSGHSTRLRSSALEVVQDMREAYGWSESRLRPPVPSAAAIDAMDKAYAWLALIPDAKYVLRRIVAARSLVHPLTDRHLFPWRRLGTALGADHKAIQRWWSQGIDLIVGQLGQRTRLGAVFTNP